MFLNCGVGEDSWESLGLQGDQPVHPKGNQSWIFIGRTDAEAETPILWPFNGKNWLIGKDPDAGKDWRWEEKETTEDNMVGWHHGLNGHEFEQAPGVGDGQGGLACCRVGHNWATELNWTELKWTESLVWSSGMTIVGSHVAPLFPIIKHQWMTVILKHPWWVTEQLQITHHLHQQQSHCFRGWSWILAAPNRTPHTWCLVSNLSALFWVLTVHFCFVCVCVQAQSINCVWLFETPWTPKPDRFPCPWESPGKNAAVGFHSLLQGIFPTQGRVPFVLCDLNQHILNKWTTWETHVTLHSAKSLPLPATPQQMSTA